jgi:anti-sigma factor RsiW
VAGVNPLAFRREELFSAFLDGELRGEEAELVNELLAAAREAKDEFGGIQQVRRAVRDLPELEIPYRLLPGGHFGDRLSAYLDGELSTAEQRQISGHVIRCVECRGELHELDRARIAIRALPGVEGDLSDLPGPPRSGRRRLAMAGGVGIAAAAVLFVGIASSGGGQEPSFSIEDLASQHFARASAEPGFTVFPPAIEISGP